MTKTAEKKIAFISSFLPRKCGIATFTSDLIKNINLASNNEFDSLVLAMQANHNITYDDRVKFEIRQNVKNDYVCAADYINFSHVDVVSIQHEFGLFGGEAGSYLTLLLNRLKVPVITTLHTVLNNPNPFYYKSTVDVCQASDQVITMNERGVNMLRDIYGIADKKIQVIPHGIPDLPFVDNNYYKHKFAMEGRRTILTFGLLSKNKGIEVMLDAMPTIIKADPTVLYIVLGMTHPSVVKYDGESYRFSLQRKVKELGIEDHVIFHNRFVNDEELNNFLCASDIYVTPYLDEEQLTSGTLSFAVGTGKAVVSTPYWAAKELLADGRGKLVDFGNSGQLTEAIIEILKNDSLFYSLRRQAYDYGRSRIWPKIGQQYWKLFSAKRAHAHFSKKTTASSVKATTNIQLPELSLEHLQRLTDDTGLYQHAWFTIPNRKHGYCTDDNARALIAITEYYAQYPCQESFRLFNIYLSFVLYSQNDNGTVRNFMNFDRTWHKNESLNDALGRVLWSLGTVMVKPPLPSYLHAVKNCFDKSVKCVNKQHPRGLAYSILGMSNYLEQFPGASDIKRYLTFAADKLVSVYEKNSHPDWRWFENQLTYDNAILPHALFVAGHRFGHQRYLEIAEESLEFLIRNTFNGMYFSFIGCEGWHTKGSNKATFDQQPIECASMVMALKAAYEATLNPSYLTLQRNAFDWFLGENELHIPVYDFRTKGCNDGLTRSGLNTNQGAESTLSFLMSLLSVIENYTTNQKIETKTMNAKDIKSISRQTKTAKLSKQVKNL